MPPLTREQREAYGPDWPAVSLAVRERSGGRCECEGECLWARHVDVVGDVMLAAARGLPAPEILDAVYAADARCTARNGEPSPYTGSKVVLTVAHLDRNGLEGVNDLERLRAFCQGCHLSYDKKERG